MFISAETAEKLNDNLFLSINAPAQATPVMLDIGNVCASWLIILFPLVLACYWFSFKPHHQRQVLLAVTSGAIALAINMLIGLFWPHPRPFMVPIGHTFLSHAADSSFPSDHMTLACAISFSLLLARRARAGAMLVAFSLVIAWGRIYMGVHFPADMLGSVIVAFFSTWGVSQLAAPLDPLFNQICRINNAIFGALAGQRTQSDGR